MARFSTFLGLTTALCGSLSLLVHLPAGGASPAESPAEAAHEVLARRCFSCHGAARISDLDLRSRGTALKGGKRGPAVVPGDPHKSLLYRTVSGGDALHMPPSGALAPEEKEALRQWVAAGAPWPASASSGTSGWALRDLKTPPVPKVRRSGWVRNPIDAFVLAGLEARRLSPSPPADRRTLIRRVAFDLTGLPPTPAEVTRFLSDRAPDAYARMVDRYLASPAYGERWARHWLDIVRFAESQGFERDKIRENSWHYRDYVIRAFNEDMPYDRFIREQIAGDVLPNATADSIAATGFLVAGPWDEVGSTQASSAMRARVREDELEDMVSATAQTFLGLTANCARCHNHKFDPIPQRDYYRLQAALAGVRHGERPLLTVAEQADRAAEQKRLSDQAASLRAQLGELEAAGRKQAKARNPGTTDQRPVAGLVARWDFGEGLTDRTGGVPLTLSGGARWEGGRLLLQGSGAYARSAPLPFDLSAKTLEAWVELPTLDQGGGSALTVEDESGQTFDAIVFAERQPRKWMAGSNGFVRTRDLAGREEVTPPGSLIHVAITYAEDGRISVFRNGEPYSAPYLPGGDAGHPQEFRAGGSHVLFGLRHLAAGAPGSRSWLRGSIAEARIYHRALSEDEVRRSFESGPPVITTRDAVAALTPEQATRWEQLQSQLKGTDTALARLAAVPLAYAANPQAPPAVFVLRRGDITQKGEAVAPGGLSCLRQLSADFGLAADAPDAERRLKLADWLADRRNPLPARVMVNRVWQYHFGRGIVPTPSDFGINGEPPSHPELLDWLAATFASGAGVQGPGAGKSPHPAAPGLGWSLKKLHRLILLSNAYQQGGGQWSVVSGRKLGTGVRGTGAGGRSEASVAAKETGNPHSAIRIPQSRNPQSKNPQSADADNRFLWRMSPRRMEAEEIRDAILAISGDLNPQRGGPGFRPFSVVINNSHFYTYEDRVGPEYNRRSIYRTIVNSGGVPLLETFDCPDPSTKTPRRATTTTPLQALALFNNSFVLREARSLAARLEHEAGPATEAQVARAYELVLSRPPSHEESRRDAAFVRQYGLSAYCRVLFNSSEFLHVW